MKCMCAQTRPRFILSSEGVLGGMEFEPMLTPREKSPLPENVPRGGSSQRHCGQRAQALPTELFRPPHLLSNTSADRDIPCHAHRAAATPTTGTSKTHSTNQVPHSTSWVPFHTDEVTNHTNEVTDRQSFGNKSNNCLT